MKKGGYQILELKCESSVKLYNDYGAKGLVWVNIKQDFNYNKNSFSLYLDNLFLFNKTCLIKNLLFEDEYLTFFTQMITGTYLNKHIQDSIYVIDSTQEKGYSIVSTDEHYYCLINNDYALIIDGADCTAIITKLYKGAITQ